MFLNFCASSLPHSLSPSLLKAFIIRCSLCNKMNLSEHPGELIFNYIFGGVRKLIGPPPFFGGCEYSYRKVKKVLNFTSKAK